MVTRLAVALAFQTVILAFSFLSERLICAIYISDGSSGLLLWWDDLMNWGCEMTLWIRSDPYFLACWTNVCFYELKDDAQLDLMNDMTCIIHYLLLTRSAWLWLRRDKLKVTGREEFISFSLDNEHQHLEKWQINVSPSSSTTALDPRRIWSGSRINIVKESVRTRTSDCGWLTAAEQTSFAPVLLLVLEYYSGLLGLLAF